MSGERREEALAQLRGADGRVYVLRVWYEGAATDQRWRASLREGSGERRHFASLDACLEYLYGELGRP